MTPRKEFRSTGLSLKRWTTSLWLVALSLLPAPLRGADEWYVYYQRAIDGRTRNFRGGQCTDVSLANLQKAIELRPRSELNARTYGVEFVDYTPYYYIGLCYLQRRDNANAQKMFATEEELGVIKRRSQLWTNLQARRSEIDSTDRQRLAAQSREEAQKHLQDGDEKRRQRNDEGALEAWTKAEAIFKIIDPGMAIAIEKRKNELAEERREASARRTRTEQIAALLADGERFAAEGKDTDAIMKFDAALLLDPGNTRAREGKDLANDRLRQSSTRARLAERFTEGQRLFVGGQYVEAVRPLTDAAADPANVEARRLLAQAQQRVRTLRLETERQSQIARLEADADRLFIQSRHPEAELKYEEILRLDPNNTRARERRQRALELTATSLMARFLPNLTPLVVLMAPSGPSPEVDSPTLKVEGVVTDDRQLIKVEVFLNGERVADIRPTPLEAGEMARTQSLNRSFPLSPGANSLRIVATDAQGLTAVQAFTVTRRLRFYETRAFLPVAALSAVGLIGAGLAVQRLRRRRAVTRRFNPYIAGAPVIGDDMFFGRQKLLARILNVLHHNSLLITGERRIGKTSLLLHLKKALEKDDREDYRFFPVTSDLQGVPESAFFHTLMADVVETIKPSPVTLGALKFGSEDQTYEGRDFSHDLQRAIEELKARTPKKVKLALLIDEVDELNQYSDRVNQRLRSIFMKTFSENLVAVMSGVGIRRNWKSEGSPWYNFFDEIELAAFSREEAEELIRTPVQGVFRYTPDAVESIIQISRLRPYAIQRLCIHAVNRMLEDGRTTIDADDVNAAGDALVSEERREDVHAAPVVS